MAEKRNYKRLQLGAEQMALRLPASPQELVDVSLNSGRAQSNPLFELAQEHPENERILTLTNQLEMRLQVYLQTMVDTEHGTEPALSEYAAAVLDLSRVPTTKRQADPRWKDLQEIDQYVRPEITFLLKQLAEAIPCDSQTLMQRLRTARIEGKSVATIFALWGRLHPFELDKKPLPARVVVVDPLDATNAVTQAYWQKRRQHQEIYGNATLPGLIELKRIKTSTELYLVAEAVPVVAEACNTIREWIETDVGSIRPDADEGTFAYYAGRVDFMLLPPEQSIPILIALATLKQQVPEVYLRLIGIAPEGDAQTQEVRQSDLFGSPVQIALYRLMQRTDLPETIRTYVDELTQMDVDQTALLYMDESRFKKISQRLLQEQEREKAEGQQGIPASVLTAMMLVRPEVVRAYQMQQELRRMMEVGAADQMPKMLERLRVGTPGEVLEVVKKIMQPATESGSDGQFIVDYPEVREVLEKRFKPFPLERMLSFLLYAENQNNEISRMGLRDLWMSAPKETLQSREFADYVMNIAESLPRRQWVDSRGERVMPNELHPFLEILAHHKLRADEWEKSACRISVNEDNYHAQEGILQQMFTGIAKLKESQRIAQLTKALVKIFKQIDPYVFLDEGFSHINAGEYLAEFCKGVVSIKRQEIYEEMEKFSTMDKLPFHPGFALGLIERQDEPNFGERLKYLETKGSSTILMYRFGMLGQSYWKPPVYYSGMDQSYIAHKLSPREKKDFFNRFANIFFGKTKWAEVLGVDN